MMNLLAMTASRPTRTLADDAVPGLARRVAAMVAGRLDATSALLVELSKQNKGKGLLSPRDGVYANAGSG
jgi:hypothetical protein